jgi:hypothetical protein
MTLPWQFRWIKLPDTTVRRTLVSQTNVYPATGCRAEGQGVYCRAFSCRSALAVAEPKAVCAIARRSRASRPI